MSALAVSSWEEIGARVTAARKIAGLTQQDVAQKLGLDRTAITRIESGQRETSARELALLANVLGRPLLWFLSIPSAAIAGRRANLETDAVHQVDTLLEDFGDGVGQLIQFGLLEPNPYRVVGDLVSFEDAERAADETRAHIGAGPGPLWDLIRVAEKLGLYACSLPLEDARVDGAYAVLDGAGVAVVNGDFESGRRRFTLAHEVGHHVFQDKYADDRDIAGSTDERERLINAFAIHLLMPRNSATQAWRELVATRASVWERALLMGVRFGVSWTALCLQLRNLGLIDQRTYAVLAARRPVGADYLALGVDLRDDLHPPRVPPAYAAAVVKAYNTRRIGRGRALELMFGTIGESDLRLKPQPLSALRSELGKPLLR